MRGWNGPMRDRRMGYFSVFNSLLTGLEDDKEGDKEADKEKKIVSCY